MSIGDPWPDLDEAELRVLAMQRKLHHWAKIDPERRFDDLHNLVYDPFFLVVVWERVRGNKGARTAGVDGIAPRSVGFGAGELLSMNWWADRVFGLRHSCAWPNVSLRSVVDAGTFG